MKTFSPQAKAEIEAGTAISTGAVLIACAPDPVRLWGGFGPLLLPGDDQPFLGVGDAGLVSASGGALGGAAQNVTLALSGVDPEAWALFDATALRDAPTVIWRLIFSGDGHTLLSAPVFTRGRLDQLPVEEVLGGKSTIRAMIEGAAKGLGRSRSRTRSDSDQRQDDPDDAGFSATAYAGQKTIYFGGKVPASVSSLPGVREVVSKYEA